MRYLSIIFILTCSGAALGQTQVPNVIQSGTPAVADEVNANFSTLESAVNQNADDIVVHSAAIDDNLNLIADHDNRIQAAESNIGENQGWIVELMDKSGVRVYDQGGDIGRVMAITDSNPQAAGNIWIISNAGFVTSVDMMTGAIREDIVHYSQANCNGQAYVSPSSIANVWALVAGMVIKPIGSGVAPAYYSPRGSSASLATLYNSTKNGSCTNAANTGVLYEVFPNDPSITGFSDTSPVGPLKMGLP